MVIEGIPNDQNLAKNFESRLLNWDFIKDTQNNDFMMLVVNFQILGMF